jgi:plasmid maintenance system antidote protein VapI
MAIRLSIAFGTSAESWLNQQTQYDLWHAERALRTWGHKSLQRLKKPSKRLAEANSSLAIS